MSWIHEIFGSGEHLSVLQMSCRGVLIFFLALILIRLSGKRSFGLNMPLDNIITITLGAILSRALVGASSFLAVIVTCTIIVFIHRFIGWLTAHHPGLSKLVEGEKILLYENGQFLERNMDKALVCREDIMQGVRKTALTESLTRIDKIYLERNGEISAVKKDQTD